MTDILVNYKIDKYHLKMQRKNQFVKMSFYELVLFWSVLQTVKETIGVGVNEKAALSSDKNCPFVYINFDFTLVNKVASL